MKYLSIIVPVYSVERYIEKCLSSVLYPELDGYEVIIVDDGSPDGSGSICQDYARRYPQIMHYIRTENRGLGAARNCGLMCAKGEFVLFLDSDDSLAPGAVPEILELIQSSDIDICIYGIKSLDEAGREVPGVLSCPIEGAVPLKDYPRLLLCPPSGCNKLVRRSLMLEQQIFFPARAWFEDLRTMPKLYLLTDKIISVHKPWYLYLQREGSITKSYVSPRNLEIIEAVNDLSDHYRRAGAYTSYEKELDFIAFYNIFLVTSMRFCLADPESPCLEELRRAYKEHHPDIRQNPYYKEMSPKHKLLTALLEGQHYRLAGQLMNMKNTLRRKKVGDR